MTSFLPSNYFTSPLIGTDIRQDGINPTEILNYLFKKSFGIPNGKAYFTYNREFPDYNSTPSVKNDKIYSQKIPNTITKPTITNNSLDLNDTNFIEDSNWINIGYASEYIGGYNNALGQKYISKIYPYLTYYNNVKMVTTGYPIAPNGYYNGLQAPKAPSFIVGSNTTPQQTICLSTNIIPYFYGDATSYNITLKDNTSTTLLFGDPESGSWIMDTDSGVLTFYDDVRLENITVDAENPPRISYWRYEGLTGNANIVEVFDA
jgi:hypothetical protein